MPEIPQSKALEEALPDSLAELFARDPSEYSEGDWQRIIGEMRKQRDRLLLVEGASPPKAPKGAKPLKIAPILEGTDL